MREPSRLGAIRLGYADPMTRLVPLVVVLFALGLVACGGDDDSSAPSKQEFAQNADKICNKAEKEIEKIGQGAESPGDVADAIDQVIDKSRDAADDLAALDRPEGADGEKAQKFAEGFKQELNEKLVPALEKLQTALKNKDAQAAQAAAADLQKLESTESDKFARELGANACVGSA